jgi:hypothetical protein
MQAGGRKDACQVCNLCKAILDILQGACAGLSWGMYFTAYNNAKIRWQGLRHESSLPAPLHLLSAAEAGCIVIPLTIVLAWLQN